MEYLAETGELFLDPGIVSYTNTKPENNYNNNAIITSPVDNDVENEDNGFTLVPNSSTTLEESTNNTSWSVWLSSMINRSSSNIQSIPSTLEKKYYSAKSMQQISNTVLAKRVTKTCRNGDLYTGLVDAVTGEPVHGRKVYVSTGEIYEGPFHNNKRHGYGGINTKSDGGKFIGRFEYDKPKEGTYITSKFTYTGGLLEGMAFHGEGGCLAEENGNVYKGDFQYGLFHGCGLQCSNEFSYKGEFNKGERHGFGSCSIELPLLSCVDKDKIYTTYFNEVVCIYKYTGKWHHGVKNGKGSESLILSKKDNDSSITSTFVGNFNNNKRNGLGELTLFDGTILEGLWTNDIPILTIQTKNLLDDTNITKSAKWRITFNYGDVYDGEVLSNNNNEEIKLESNSFLYKWNKSEPVIIPHGIGTMSYSSTGDVYNGNFYMGKRHGLGLCIYQQSGDIYNGLWHDDKPVHSNHILFPLYHPSTFDIDVIATDDDLIFSETDEQDGIDSGNFISSIQLILSVLNKGRLDEEVVVEQEHHQQNDLLDIETSNSVKMIGGNHYTNFFCSEGEVATAEHLQHDLLGIEINKSANDHHANASCGNTTSFHYYKDTTINQETTKLDISTDDTNPKVLKRLDGTSTPPTISSSSLSSCDDDNMLLNDDVVDDLIRSGDDADLLDVDDDVTANNVTKVDNVHHLRGMIHHDQKKAIFTMYTRLQE